jgi:hypothetical protein
MRDPVLIAYAVWRVRGKVRYQRAGHVYPHGAGEGLTVILDALPLNFNGKLVLLERDEADDRRLLAEARRASPKADQGNRAAVRCVIRNKSALD